MCMRVCVRACVDVCVCHVIVVSLLGGLEQIQTLLSNLEQGHSRSCQLGIKVPVSSVAHPEGMQ